ncbi:putative polygalacturonase At3g15720 [Tasmannia lanceolata]|uniref:putative polygalacturonase At3g15720 n=1 Tax=Tasmannia lanceolata TaxID=3420 RepID=UPI00406337C4
MTKLLLERAELPPQSFQVRGELFKPGWRIGVEDSVLANPRVGVELGVTTALPCDEAELKGYDRRALGAQYFQSTSCAFLKAWGAVCYGEGHWPILYIPAGKTFLLRPTQFSGPCKSPITFVLLMGNLVAPKDTSAWKGAAEWIQFYSINKLTIHGSGKMDGQGSSWWARHCRIDPRQKCTTAPTALSFQSVHGLDLKGWKLTNSPRNHININGCSDVFIDNIVIWAPEDSPNTDGINIGNSRHLEIRNSNIGSGDDCISLLSGTSYVNISWITCGPGHGISIGSLGQWGTYATVAEIKVEHCKFVNTMNGARIKTWQGGSGYVKGVTFQDIDIDSVQFPIIIDQYYCTSYNCKNHTLAVRVSDVKFIGIHGKSTDSDAIKIACSRSVPCTDIVLKDVKIKHVNPRLPVSSDCINAHGPGCPSCIPQVPCLGH